jgi:solute carrier family 10 (sodium/bile acid cotransporter), member 7
VAEGMRWATDHGSVMTGGSAGRGFVESLYALWRQFWFVGCLGLVVLLAARAPGIGSPHGLLHASSWSWLIVPAMFTVSGLLLRTHEIRSAAADWRLHAFTQAYNLLVLPLAFWGAALVSAQAQLDASLCTGVVVLGALSTTTTTGVAFTREAGGDEAGALFNATLGSLLGVIASPIIILAATGRSGQLPILEVMGKLVVQVVLPIIAGQLIQLVIPHALMTRARKSLSMAGLVLLLLLVYLVFCASLEGGLGASAGQLAATAVLVAVLHVGAIAGAFLASAWPLWRLSRARRTAAVICSTQKTAALGLPLLLVVFGGDHALGLIALPLLIYHPLQLFAASIMVPWWRRWNGVGER